MTSGWFPRTEAAVKVAGVDPNTVSINGLNTLGYEEFVLRDGNRQVNEDTGTFETRFVKWPSDVDGEHIFQIYKTEYQAYTDTMNEYWGGIKK